MSDAGDSDFSLDHYDFQHSLDFYRLRWRIAEGPIWGTIHVLDDPCDANSPQRPFQSQDGTMHEVASRPLCDDPELTKLVVHSMGEDEDDTLPRLYFKLSDGQSRFTIGEYVLRVHPWLVQHRERALPTSVESTDTQLWVDVRQPTVQSIPLLNTAKDDMDEAWAWAACEAQDIKYQQKFDTRAQARLLDGEEPKASLAFHGLRWEVREGGSIRQCVRVVKDPADIDSEVVPFQTDAGGYHEIADMPATVESASKLVLYFPALEGTKLGLNRWQAHDSEEGGDFDLTPKPANVASEWSPELTLTPGEGREFVSIKDYVLGAYDWIVSMRSRVLDSGQRWIQHEGPEEAWLDPMSVYAVGLFNTRQHILREQWQLVTWAAQDMQT